MALDNEEKQLRDELVEMYWEKNKSLHEISKEVGVPSTNLWRMFNKFGIARRNDRQALKVRWKKRRIKNVTV